jgi:hypothetical protein
VKSSGRLRIGWKVSSLSMDLASLRYRALLPILALQAAGAECVMFSSPQAAHLDALDALVIVKSFSPGDVLLAQRAAERGVPVIYDLCDNVLLPLYGAAAARIRPAQVLHELQPYVACFVTPTRPLADQLQANFPDTPVQVIPDGIEDPELLHRGPVVFAAAAAYERANRMWVYRQKARNVALRIRREGLTILPRLSVHVVRRARQAAAKRILRLGDSWLRGPGLAARVTTVPSASTAPASASATETFTGRRLLWFGNHGAPHGNFGIGDLTIWRDALETVASEFDVELVVVSNHPSKYAQLIKPMRIRSRYVEWTVQAVERELALADVVLVPNSLDSFSICKSANRTVHAVTRSVPVVATRTPALEPLLPHVHVGDPLPGLRSYLSDTAAGRTAARVAAQAAREAFSQPAIGSAWLSLIEQVRDRRPAQHTGTARAAAC